MRKIVLSIALAALSPPAFAQTTDAGPIVAVHIRHSSPLPDAATKDVGNATGIADKTAAPAGDRSAPSIWARVPRYKTTLVATQVSFYANTCAFYSAGVITFPMEPKYGKATAGTAACTIPPGQVCAGHSYSNCAGIYYERTAHNNKSARSPSAEGPVDIFTYKWDVPPYISEAHSPDIAVPVVRPTGETNKFIGWQEGYGKWRVTLVPPGNDPTFDFTGERIQETFLSDNDSCVGPVSPPNAITIEHGPPGEFGDSVGYSACVVEYARAAKKTPCGYRIRQRMEINAPSDGDATYTYSINTLIATVTGQVIYPAGQLAIGQVTSQRITPLSAPKPEVQGLTTRRLDCLGGLHRFPYLFRF